MSTAFAIPATVVDHPSYRRWLHAEEFPGKTRLSYFDGAIWIDLAKEEFFTHNQVRTAFYAELGSLLNSIDMGYFCGRGMLWSNLEAAFSTEPDGMFFTYDGL